MPDSLTPTLIDLEYAPDYDAGAMPTPAPAPDTRTNWKATIGTASGIAVFFGGLVWAAHVEISKIDDRMAALDKRMAKLEIAIKILSDAQDNKTKELVHDALSVAQAKIDSGNVIAARRSIGTANQLIAESKNKKEPAPPEFFNEALIKYTALRLASNSQLVSEAFEGKLQLAEYRSSLTQIPAGFNPEYSYIGKGVQIGHLEQRGPFFFMRDSLIAGQEWDIDGFYLRNVVFENATIVYRGGPIRLENVRFVNCTFQVTHSAPAERLLEAVALEQPSATIG